MNKHKVIRTICDCRKRQNGRVHIDDILRALGRRVNSGERDRMVKTLRKDYKGYVEHVKGDGSVRVKQRALIENARTESRTCVGIDSRGHGGHNGCSGGPSEPLFGEEVLRLTASTWWSRVAPENAEVLETVEGRW